MREGRIPPLDDADRAFGLAVAQLAAVSTPSPRIATASTSMRSANASSTACGQPITATTSSSSRSGSAAARRSAVRSDSSNCAASRAAPAGSGAARMRAHSHHSGACAGWCASTWRQATTRLAGSGAKAARASAAALARLWSATERRVTDRSRSAGVTSPHAIRVRLPVRRRGANGCEGVVERGQRARALDEGVDIPADAEPARGERLLRVRLAPG